MKLVSPRFSFLRCFPMLSLVMLAMLSSCLKSPSEPAVQEPASITLSSYSLVLTSIGQRVLINATVLDQDSRVISDATIFFRSGNEKIATVGNSGLVTAVSMGSTQITVTSGYATASATVTVMQEADSITISPPSATLTMPGETVQLTAEVKDTGDTVISGAAVVWSSSDPQYATVDSNGLVTAVSIGTTRITATSAGVSQSSTVYVEIPKPAARIDLNISQATLTSVGQSLKLDALVYDIDGVAIPSAMVAWSSSHPVVAAVDTTGLVSAVANGTTLVTATSGGITTFATIHVVIEGTVPPPPPPPVAARIEISPPSATLTEVGETVQLAATVYDTNDEIIAGALVAWSSSVPAVATVDADGLVTSVSNGTAQITATSGGVPASATISVEIEDPEPPPPPPEPSDDREALIAFYHATGGPQWTNRTNWLTDAPLGEWHGVTTGENGRVIELFLRENDLSGELPSELGSLSELTLLDLDMNRLTGGIPAQLGQLNELHTLLLGYNQLTGDLPPELGQLKGLTTLWAPKNSLSGELPPVLGQMASLFIVALNHNSFIGNIPPELGQLTNLNTIGLQNNHLSGSIPPELGQLQNLQILTLHKNQLTGSIPPELGQLKNLVDLLLPNNQLSGAIPSELGQLESVKQIDLNNNQLTGVVPPELGDLSNLQRLILNHNADLAGPLPLSLVKLNLEYLNLDSTRLCAPENAEFQTWLESIPNRSIVPECSTDREALIALYHATDGPNWTYNENWVSDELLGDWYGVTTDDDGRVIWLLLIENNLVGTIPAELGQLSKLTTVDFYFNQISGSIPVELDQLSNLTFLDLSENGLSGGIPSSLANLANLATLNFCNNELTGSIPSELGQLTNLSGLIVCNNQLFNSIPAELGQLSNLTRLGLYGNQLSGSIPSELGQLRNMVFLRLDSNNLEGGVPSELGSLTSMKTLDLHNNQRMSGPLPSSLINVNLSKLHLESTQLCVPAEAEFQTWLAGIPDKSGVTECSTDRDALIALYNATDGPNWTNNTNWLNDEPLGEWNGVTTVADGRVTELNLGRNGLSGSLPSSLGILTELQVLHLFDNELKGTIPPSLINLPKLRELWLDGNDLTGSLPSSIDDTSELRELFLDFNKLSGSIPPSISDLTKLEILSLTGNELSGSIPASLGNMSNLETLTLGGNGLNGTIPPSLGNLSNLERLSLYQNDLSGSIPMSLGSLVGLRLLELYDNKLTGTIPPSLSGLSTLTTLNLGLNRLHGTIPTSLGDLQNLEALSLNKNDLSGSIPSSLTNLSELQILYLFGNGFSDCIPPGLYEVPLNDLNRFGLPNCDM